VSPASFTPFPFLSLKTWPLIVALLAAVVREGQRNETARAVETNIRTRPGFDRLDELMNRFMATSPLVRP
jgi:hypothetical protein